MALPASNTNNNTPFFGCKISLISKSEIRYEGILYTIDPKESTIALAKVKSYGSEDRPVERPVPARDDIFEFIIFRASDIKDLIVDEPAPAPTPQLTDPAIIQAHATSTSFPSSFPPASINANAAPPSAPAPVQQPPQQQSSSAVPQLQPTNKGHGPAGVSLPKQQAQQQQHQTDASDGGVKSKPSTSAPAPINYSKAAGGGGGSSAQQQQPKQPNQQRQNNLQYNKQQQKSSTGGVDQQQAAPGQQLPFRSNNQQPSNVQNQNGYVRRNQNIPNQQQNRVIGENQNPNYHARNGGGLGGLHQGQQNQQGGFTRPFNSRFSRGGGQQQGGQGGGFSGGFRRGGGPGGIGGGPRTFQHRPLPHHNGPKFPPIPDGDFDFEKAQADFKILEEKLHALKLNVAGVLPDNGEGNSATDGASAPESTEILVPGIPASAISVAALEQEEQERPKEPCYNKKKSFFDNISCEALEREKGGHRVDWKAERKLNRETFGVVSSRRPTFFRMGGQGGNQHHRGGYGGSGGFHGGRGGGGYHNQQYRGSGGYYQNRNYNQHRSPRNPNNVHLGNANPSGGSNNVSSTTNSTSVTSSAGSAAAPRTPKSTTNGLVGASPSSTAPVAIATKN